MPTPFTAATTRRARQKPIPVGVCRFRDPAIAAKVEANRAAFKATVNREGMTAGEREAALAAFFAPRVMT